MLFQVRIVPHTRKSCPLLFYRIETAREKAFLRTEYSGMHLWCRKRTSGVPNEPRGGGNVPDYHLTLEAMKRLVFISNWT